MPILLLALLPVPPKLTGESAPADEAQRQTNADALRAVFDLVLAPLQEVVQEGREMDCADGKTRLCFPILSAWIADHAEHADLHGIGSKSCLMCEVPSKERGGDPRKIYEACDYALYWEKAQEQESGEAGIAEYFQQVGVKIGRNVFAELYGVNLANLHKPHLLHNIYLGLFKHMMEWVAGFLKKHKRQQAFDDAWKELSFYPGFSVPKKAYLEVTQSQGKEMRNLGRGISAVLASALGNQDSSQHPDFNIAWKCVGALLDFSLITQYRSHTPDTLGYMERYLQTFHHTKDIFLEFRTSKSTSAEVNRQDQELRILMANEIAQEAHHISAAKRRRQADQNRLERVNRRADLIQRENHFNFIKMHYLCHFASHVRCFGSILMYSTEMGELAHKEQIKEGYRRANENNAALQILSYYGRKHALGMRLQTIEALAKAETAFLMGNGGVEALASSRSAPRRVLKGRMMENIGTLTELCIALNIDYSDMIEEMLRFIRQTIADDQRLPSDRTELGSLPVEQFTHLEIPVPDYQDTDVFQIHRARCTGTKAFRNGGPRNNWVWVQAGGEKSYGDLRGRVVARLLALFKIRNVLSGAGDAYRLALVRILDPVGAGSFHCGSGHIRVSKRSNGRDMRIVAIGAVIGQAHVTPSGERQWIVNHRIDLRTF